MRSLPIALVALSCIAAWLPAPQARAGDVTIYRCVDARGHIALRDSPCVEGERQEVRNMGRPLDPPPSAAAANPPSRPPAYNAVSSGGGFGDGRTRWQPGYTTPPPTSGSWVNGSWVRGSWMDR